MRRKLKHSETLSTIKNLLSSYEIFILGTLGCMQRSRTAVTSWRYLSSDIASARPSCNCSKSSSGSSSHGSVYHLPRRGHTKVRESQGKSGVLSKWGGQSSPTKPLPFLWIGHQDQSLRSVDEGKKKGSEHKRHCQWDAWRKYEPHAIGESHDGHERQHTGKMCKCALTQTMKSI